MKLLKLSLALLLLLSSFLSFAGIVRPTAKYLKTIGLIHNVKWAPDHYTNGFKYDVFYYIPAKLKDATNAKALIYMHGGGSSTMTRDGSLNVASMYMTGDVKRIADDLGIVVVVPSASGLNWGSHTSMLRHLAITIKADLDVDPNNIGLTGHSMGGMGITRSYSALADEFAYIVPQAAGMDVVHQTEQHLLKSFNVPYVHLQGKNDHFAVFVERCQEQLKRMTALEQKMGEKSKFEMIFHEGAHNPDYNLTLNTLKRLQASPRNIYQKTLYGALVAYDVDVTENNITYRLADIGRYFWVTLLEADRTRAEGLNFVAKITDNEINITLDNRPAMIRKLRVLLSKKLVDLSKPVTIKVDGEVKAIHQPGTDLIRGSADKTDATFVFEEFADIAL